MLAIEAQGKNIRTVDGLAQGNALHPVQQAFCDNDGLMCGFCTPGFVMATVALLEKNPNPDAEQAKKALDGNLCRCGTNIGVLESSARGEGGDPWITRLGTSADRRIPDKLRRFRRRRARRNTTSIRGPRSRGCSARASRASTGR